MKKQHKHTILPVIYPDRFMHCNRAVVEALRKKVAILRKKITFLKDCLKQYTDFNGSGISLEQALRQSLHFFVAQGQQQMPATNLKPSEMSDVQTLLPLAQAPFESALVQQVLDTYKNKVTTQISQLEQ